MKKFAFLPLLFLLYYIASMYESPALMDVFLSQIFLAAAMWILSFYLKDHLSVSFSDPLAPAVWREPLTLKLDMENKSRLPVSSFAVCLTIRFEDTGKENRRTVPGNCTCGKDYCVFEDRMKHCGIYQVHIKWLKVCDYLSLFSRKKTIESRMEIIVFPPKTDMKMVFYPSGRSGEAPQQIKPFSAGNNHEEIRQIREYRPGDPPRHIHWNQTARTGSLWVKEYEGETKGQVWLYLEMEGLPEKSSDEKDLFYLLLYAVLRELLKEGRTIQVCWAGREKIGSCWKEVCSETECRDIFLLLYRRQGIPEGSGSVDRKTETGDIMRLTDDLALYRGNRLLRQFSKENLIQELTGHTLG